MAGAGGESGSRRGPRPGRVLVVDPDARTTADLCAALSVETFHCDSVASAQDALGAAEGAAVPGAKMAKRKREAETASVEGGA